MFDSEKFAGEGLVAGQTAWTRESFGFARYYCWRHSWGADVTSVFTLNGCTGARRFGWWLQVALCLFRWLVTSHLSLHSRHLVGLDLQETCVGSTDHWARPCSEFAYSWRVLFVDIHQYYFQIAISTCFVPSTWCRHKMVVPSWMLAAHL